MASKKPIEFRGALGTYQTDGLLGEGGAGRVYSARDNEGQIVALKVLDPSKATQSHLKRFKNEYSFGFRNGTPTSLRFSILGGANMRAMTRHSTLCLVIRDPCEPSSGTAFLRPRR